MSRSFISPTTNARATVGISPPCIGRKRKLNKEPTSKVVRRLRLQECQPSRRDVESFLILHLCKGIEDIISLNSNARQMCFAFDCVSEGSNSSLVDYVTELVRFLNRWDAARTGANKYRTIVGINEFSLGINTVLMSLIYLIRLNRERRILITNLNIRNLLLAAVTTTHKYCEERSMGCKAMSRVTDLESKELVKLEAQFCNLLQWKLAVTKETFERARARCLVSVSLYFGSFKL